MTGLMWSGPGRALEAHLALFARLDRTQSWIHDHAGPVTYKQMFDAPPTFRQRLRLMSTMADSFGPTVLQHTIDGDSLSTGRDQSGEILSQFNLARGVGLSY